jgi:transketolase
MKAMRDVFIKTVCDRMVGNHDIFFLVADLGSPALDRLRNEYPDRFINVGIAEQNLINVATGLALEGMTVYAYAIAPFIAMRAYEQIRVNLSISSQIKPINVNLLGLGGGVSYQVSGPTHHCLEDISIMRLLPNMTVFSPSDWRIAESLVDYTLTHFSPKYIRFDAKPLPALYDHLDETTLEDGFCELATGTDICLVSTGFMTHRAVKVANEMKNVGVVDLFRLKPVQKERLYGALRKYRYVMTLEEAFINNGGLDCLVSNLLAENGSSIKVRKIGFDDRYVFDLGSRDYLHRINNMDESAITELVRGAIG